MPPISHVYPEPQTPSPWWQGPANSPEQVVAKETPSPGNWQHPRIQDITKRQYATSFSSLRFHRALWNGVALLLSFIILDEWIERWFVSWLPLSISWKCSSCSVTFLGRQLDISLFPTLCVWAVRVLFIVNVIIALHPLFITTDSMDDIPLTDRQRALLGISQSSTSIPQLTPDSKFVTPPRYRRSAGSPSRRSPSSTRSSPLNPTQRSASPSSFMSTNSRARGRSPFDSSPLSQTGLLPGSQERVGMYGSPMQGGRSVSLGPSTPSPAGRARNGNINYKWLYEKGGRLPRSESGF